MVLVQIKVKMNKSEAEIEAAGKKDPAMIKARLTGFLERSIRRSV